MIVTQFFKIEICPLLLKVTKEKSNIMNATLSTWRSEYIDSYFLIEYM